jgi:hypothetical protein
MAYTPIPLIVNGDVWNAATGNALLRDNFAVGVPAVFTAAGDLVLGSGVQTGVVVNIGVGDGKALLVKAANPGKVEWAYPDHGSLLGLGDDDHALYYHTADHTKANHDALGINADTLDTYHAASFALLASPTFTGTPAAPTAAVDINTTQIATCAFVIAQINTPIQWSATLDGTSGWYRVGVTETYASATTFTVPGNLTALFGTPGLKIRFTQGGVIKYFYCVSATYGAPNTTVTVTPGVDSTGTAATVANSAITLPYFSRAETPEGFPCWIPYTPVWTCATGTAPDIGNGTLVGLFKIYGKDVHLRICLTAGNTTTFGNGGNWCITVPVPIYNDGIANYYLMGHARDTGTANYGLQVQPNASISTAYVSLMSDLHWGTNTNYLTNAVPFAWTTNDLLTIHGFYRWSA